MKSMDILTIFCYATQNGSYLSESTRNKTYFRMKINFRKVCVLADVIHYIFSGCSQLTATEGRNRNIDENQMDSTSLLTNTNSELVEELRINKHIRE